MNHISTDIYINNLDHLLNKEIFQRTYTREISSEEAKGVGLCFKSCSVE